MSTDLELLDAWLGGDDQAAEALVKRHFDTLYAFFSNKVGDDVDDLIQATFAACVTYRDRFASVQAFRPYLLATARHQLVTHFKRARKHGPALDPTVHTVADLSPRLSKIVAEHQEQRLLLEGLRRLPLDAQVVLELHYWEDLTTSELAIALEVPLGTVKSRLRRAKDQLRRRLEELDTTPEPLQSTLMNLDRWARSIRAQAKKPSSPR